MEKVLLLLPAILIAYGIGKLLLKKPKIIKAPCLGILDLSNGESNALIASDRTALECFFQTSAISTNTAPLCDVLMIYGRVEPGGNLKNVSLGLREIIRDAHAFIVIIATENPIAAYIEAGKRKPYGRANLVMTLNRKGDAFARFFRELFSLMKQGTSMPVAWNKLAPQIPNMDQKDCPDTVFACEVGQITFL